MIEKTRHKFRKGFFEGLVIFLFLLAFTIDSSSQVPPTPHSISGFIFRSDGITQVPLGTKFKVNDTNNGNIVYGKTNTPVPDYSGKYSVVIDGADGDFIIISAWNNSNYGKSNASLFGNLYGINVSISQTRPSETNVTILTPINHSSFNISNIFNFTVNISLIGGADGINCNATIFFSNNTVLKLANWENTTHFFTTITLGNSIKTNWFVNSSWIGYSNITIFSECENQWENFDGLSLKTLFNISIKDDIAPNVTLIFPVNNNNSVDNNITFIFYVYENQTNAENCSLIVDGIAIRSNNTINKEINQSFTEWFEMGNYTWLVNCSDSAGNTGSSEIRNLSILDPDLGFSEGDIFFSNDFAQENETIIIYLNVHNYGNEYVYNAILQIYENEPENNSLQINSNISINLGPGENITIGVNYTTKLGEYNITAIIDPPISSNGTIDEYNEDNNKIGKILFIPIWQIYYGDVIKNIMVGNNENQSVLKWFNETYINGNIYVSDSDSNIAWTELQALGKNSSNESTINDFEELDNSLNYNALPKNVNSSYTKNGILVNSTKFAIFGNNISNVPITNSTNNSNFYTGILWDMSDGRPEYDGTQDILFITKLGPKIEGAYGNYNYEIRVPANLKGYIVPNLQNMVSFFIELT